MKKVLFVATVFKFLYFEKSDMEILKSKGYEIHTATNMHSEDWLQDDKTLDYLELHKHQIDFERKPYAKSNITAYKQIQKLLEEEFSLMHCHTPIADAIARIAAIKYKKMV